MAQREFNRLVRQIMRNFYSMEEYLVVDALIRNTRFVPVKDLAKTLCQSEKFVQKHLRTMKKELFVSSTLRTHPDTGDKIMWWEFDYAEFLNVVKVKLAFIMRAIEAADESRQSSQQGYICPKCHAAYGDMYVAMQGGVAKCRVDGTVLDNRGQETSLIGASPLAGKLHQVQGLYRQVCELEQRTVPSFGLPLWGRSKTNDGLTEAKSNSVMLGDRRYCVDVVNPYKAEADGFVLPPELSNLSSNADQAESAAAAAHGLRALRGVPPWLLPNAGLDGLNLAESVAAERRRARRRRRTELAAARVAAKREAPDASLATAGEDVAWLSDVDEEEAATLFDGDAWMAGAERGAAGMLGDDEDDAEDGDADESGAGDGAGANSGAGIGVEGIAASHSDAGKAEASDGAAGDLLPAPLVDEPAQVLRWGFNSRHAKRKRRQAQQQLGNDDVGNKKPIIAQTPRSVAEAMRAYFAKLAYQLQWTIVDDELEEWDGERNGQQKQDPSAQSAAASPVPPSDGSFGAANASKGVTLAHPYTHTLPNVCVGESQVPLDQVTEGHIRRMTPEEYTTYWNVYQKEMLNRQRFLMNEVHVLARDAL